MVLSLGENEVGVGGGAWEPSSTQGEKISVIERRGVGGLRCHAEGLDFR